MRHLLLLVVVCVTGSVIAQDLVDPKPGNVFVKNTDLADTPLLECTLKSGAKFTTLVWKKDGVTKALCTIDKADNPGKCTNDAYDVDNTDGKKYNLKSKKVVDYTYAGAYICSVTPEAAPSPHADAKEHPGSITVVADASACTPAVTIKKNMQKTIQCKVNYKGPTFPSPVISKGDEKNISGVTYVDADKTDHTERTISAEITAEETADYKCGVASDDASALCNIKVTVEDGNVEEAPTDTSVVMGKSANLLCTMKDKATYTKVTWKRTVVGGTEENICTAYKTPSGTKKDGCVEKVKADYEINKPGNHDLKIVEAKEGLAGAYKCEVADDEHYDAELMVIKADATCEFKEENVICEFEYKGNDQPSVKWYEGDSPIAGLTPKEEGTDWKKVTLTAKVTDATKNYECKVVNEDGSFATTCRGFNTAQGLHAQHYTLLPAIVMWLCYQLM